MPTQPTPADRDQAARLVCGPDWTGDTVTRHPLAPAVSRVAQALADTRASADAGPVLSRSEWLIVQEALRTLPGHAPFALGSKVEDILGELDATGA